MPFAFSGPSLENPLLTLMDRPFLPTSHTRTKRST